MVTQEDFSHEGLEGAFDVFVGVAATQLDAMGLIEKEGGDGMKRKHPSRYVIGQGYDGDYYDRPDYNDENAVTLETWSPRYAWVNGKQVEQPEGNWSHNTTWHVRELDVLGSENLAPSAQPPGSTDPAGVRRDGSSTVPAGAVFVGAGIGRFYTDPEYHALVCLVGQLVWAFGRFCDRYAG